MLHKLRNKFAFYALKALYGKEADVATSFFGPSPDCVSESGDSTRIGILFQGPVVSVDKLIAGLRHYRYLFPYSPMVVSTWHGEVVPALGAAAMELNIRCVESEPPRLSGIMNVNKQIVSTARAIDLLCASPELDLVMKVRTDYFPWRPDRAVRTMEVHEKLLGGPARIWGVDNNTRMDLPFSFADIFQLGRVEPMKAYWTEDALYPKNISVQEFFAQTDNQRDIGAVLALQPAEIYLAVRYLRAKGCLYNYTSIEDYHKALAAWFGVFDSQYIELSFGKYSFMRPGYEPVDERKKRFVTTQDWLNMLGNVV